MNSEEMTRILVIEDKPHHLADARKVLEERVQSGAIAGVDYVTHSGYQVIDFLSNVNYDGIISDMYISSILFNIRGIAAQKGMGANKQAEYQGKIPFVLMTEPVSILSGETECDEAKGWKEAYIALVCLMEKKKSDEATVDFENSGDRVEYFLHLRASRSVSDEGIKIAIEKRFDHRIIEMALQKYCRGMFQ